MNSQAHQTLEHPRIIFILSFCIYCIGIACSSINDNRIALSIAIVGTLCILLFWWWKKYTTVGLMLLITISWWYMGSRDSQDRQQSLQELSILTDGFSWSHLIQWSIDSLLYSSDLSHTYRLNIDKIDNRSTLFSPNILVEIPKNLHLNKGDTIESKIKIQSLIEFPLSGFARYSWYQRSYGKSSIATFKRISEATPTKQQIIHESLEKIVSKWFPENVTGIILGMTIGNIEYLSSNIKQHFTNSGITHILVVSGSNIAFLIVILTAILRYIPIHKHIKITTIVSIIIGYGYIVWWDVPVIRAIIMGLITYIAIEWSRKTSSVAILCFVGYIILVTSPLALLYDAGFALSFSATLSILLFYNKILNFWKRVSIPQFINEIISISIAASIWSTIAVIYHFGNIPIWWILSNILIWGFLGWILFSSMIYFIIAPLSIWIAYIWWWTIYIPIVYIIEVGTILWKNRGYPILEDIGFPISIFLMLMLFSYTIFSEYKRLLDPK